MKAAAAYNLTDDVALCVHLLARRVEKLSHLRPAQILHGITQARNRSRYGVYAECHGLRFKDGRREHVAGRYAWVWPEVRVRGQEILYYITYFLPRFLDQPPQQRLNTLLHELWHISPRFDGDLRRFSGRNEFHGPRFDHDVDALCAEAASQIDLERFPFLRWNFEELTARYGTVVGTRLKRFRPRRVHPAELPTSLAVAPHGSRAPGRQRQLFSF
ncbi:MAG: hypothetical protein HS108_07820 [Planctomycetes bacterium]|nr:hypothetical protein [Planctomycetota bacterium]MCL4730987.1 hypothetical protein [Planctomycetota bacterium]